MNEIFSYLDELNISSSETLATYISHTNIEDIYMLCLHLRNLINKNFVPNNYSPFSFVPSGEISGAGGCFERTCRKKRANYFANWSALYADTVYLKLDLISTTHFPIDIDYIENRYLFKYHVRNNIETLLIYRELIECGIVKLSPVEKNICPDCLKKILLTNGEELDLSSLKKRYFSQGEIIVLEHDNTDKHIQVGFKNLEDFFPLHTESLTLAGEQYDKVLFYEGNIKEKISSSFAKEMIIDEVIDDSYGKACANALTAQELESKYITSIPGEIKLFDYCRSKRLNSIPQIKSIEEYVMPYISTDISTVVKLRSIEGDAFNRFRIALAKFTKESVASGKQLTSRELYDDLIYPEICRLDEQIEKTKQYYKKSFASVSILVGLLSLGVYTDIIKPEILTLLSAIDNSNALYDLAQRSIKAFCNKPDNPKENDFYFLWKATQKKSKFK